MTIEVEPLVIVPSLLLSLTFLFALRIAIKRLFKPQPLSPHENHSRLQVSEKGHESASQR